MYHPRSCLCSYFSQIRFCKLCGETDVEDEFHFIIRCPIYDIIRITMFNSASRLCESFVNLNDQDKFKLLNVKCFKPLSEYTLQAISIRQRLLFL